jgi:hypothetical protein
MIVVDLILGCAFISKKLMPRIYGVQNVFREFIKEQKNI